MEARLCSFFKFLDTQVQGETQVRKVLLQIPSKYMLLKLTPEEGMRLYNEIDEEFTKVGGKKSFNIALPRITKYTEVNNLSLLMGNGRPQETSEVPYETPVCKVLETGEVVFASMEGFKDFVQGIEDYINKKVTEEVSRKEMLK